mgnify:CR=1 FL=1
MLEKEVRFDRHENPLLDLFIIFESDFKLIVNIKNATVATANKVSLIILCDSKLLMICPHPLNPSLLHHLEEEMTAEYDLDLIKTIRGHRHSNHVAERVRKRTILHLEVETVGHLDECLDCD